MKRHRIFVINPGSTSTKLAAFEDDRLLFEAKAVHAPEELSSFSGVAEQYEYRKEAVLRTLEREGLSPGGFDAFVARTGGVYSLTGGVYLITPKVIEDSFDGRIVHPAILGCKLADDLSARYGGLALMVNPPDVDELDDVARLTGLSGMYRGSQFHALNQKETAIRAAAELGKAYGECNFVVAHIGGGVSVTAHRRGRAVDSSSLVMGDGPFAPTRAGSLPAIPLMRLCFSGRYTEEELYDRMITNGGFLDHLGTSDIMEAEKMISDGDEYARLVIEAFIYQIGKSIGAYAAVLKGDIDAILLGGGIARDEYVVGKLTEMVGFLAPVRVYPGEFEMEALAAGALRVLTGREKARQYDGVPIFSGFGHLKRAPRAGGRA